MVYLQLISLPRFRDHCSTQLFNIIIAYFLLFLLQISSLFPEEVSRGVSYAGKVFSYHPFNTCSCSFDTVNNGSHFRLHLLVAWFTEIGFSPWKGLFEYLICIISTTLTYINQLWFISSWLSGKLRSCASYEAVGQKGSKEATLLSWGGFFLQLRFLVKCWGRFTPLQFTGVQIGVSFLSEQASSPYRM